MGDLSALEVLNPNRKPTKAPVDANTPPAPQQGGAQPGGDLDPGMIQGLVSGIQTLRKLGMDDREIVDTLMQAITMKGLEISEDQIRQIVEAVPQSGQAPAGAEGAMPPPEQGGTPPQGTPNITPGG